MIKFVMKKVAEVQREYYKQKAITERHKVHQECYAKTGHSFGYVGKRTVMAVSMDGQHFEAVEKNVYVCEHCGKKYQINSSQDVHN